MFSPVEKATFTFGTLVTDEQAKTTTVVWGKEPKKVMLNPADINVSVSRQRRFRDVITNASEKKGGESTEPLSSSVATYIEDYSTVSMLLHFDLVHKYESFLSGPVEAVTSMAGFGVESLLGATGLHLYEADTFHVEGGLFKDPFSISLNKKGLTCYPDLVANAKNPYGVVKFEWGDMCYKGRISNFSSKIDYFSPWGAPLRAEVNLSIVPCDLGTEELLGVTNALSQLDTYKKVWDGITSNLRPTV